MASPSSFSTAPYPGLRPFEVEESDIFFGRERQTDELLAKLQQNRFLAVIGPSGCGKSSLVRAGLIAALETGFMSKAGSRWGVARMRPGDRPMRRLADSLLTPSLLGRERGSQPDAALFVEAALRRGPLGLIEVVAESNICRDANLLVLVDQFEEVFRFRSQGDPEEADAFVALLLATAASSKVPVYIILTMRSDFLGDCSLFHELPEAINRSAYLIPRLTRDECALAIRGPARVFGGEIDPVLVNRLLNDFGPDPDQLPLLQHALMRMWYRRTHPPPDPPQRIVIAGADYDLLGGLPRALSDHVDELMGELSTEQQRIAKIAFQRLTERASGKRDTRAPARLGDIARVAGVDLPAVAAVVDAFRSEGRCFLTPLEGLLEADTLIDIGHESLIRQWGQLAAWVDEETDSSRVYGRLRDTAVLWEARQAGLWSNPDLTRAVRWRERVNPTEAWAARYGQPDDFARAMRFLTESDQAQQAREREAERARTRELRHARRLSMTLAAIIVAILAGFVGYYYGWIRESSGYFSQFSKVRGVPKGIGTLSAQQVRHRPWSIRITRAGWFGRVRRMEAIDNQFRPTPKHDIGTYLAESESVAQRREVRWSFLYDDHGHVAHEEAYDASGNRVWGFIYAPDAGDENVRLAHFVGADGFPRQTKGYSGGYVRIQYAPEGYEEVVTYRNAMGQPRPGPNHAFGRHYAFDHDGRMLEMVSVGPDGKPMIDEDHNAGLGMKPDALGNPVEYTATDASGTVTAVRNGWSKARAKYDANGNRIELAFFDEHDRPTLSKEGYWRISQTLDDRGNIAEERYWDTEGKPTISSDCYGLHNRYDDRANLIERTCLNQDGQPASQDAATPVTRYKYDDRDNLIDVSFFDTKGRPVLGRDGFSRIVRTYDSRGNETESAVFGLDGRPVATNDGYSRTVYKYDAHDNETSRTYFGTDGHRIVIAGDDDRGDLSSTRRPLNYAGVKREYDVNGNLVREEYFDANGGPMTGPDGYASWRAAYDLSGNLSDVQYFGLRGEHVLNSDGYAGGRLQYDAFGRRIRVDYFGVTGAFVAMKDGVAGWTSSYDEAGNEVERRFHGLNGEPVTDKNGYARSRTRYDRRGEAIEYEYFGPDDKPALKLWDPDNPAKGGYARRTLTLDARGRMLETAYYGLNGGLVPCQDGWAHEVIRYDARGVEETMTYFDTSDRSLRMPGGFYGMRERLDPYGNVVEVTYLDDHDQPVRVDAGFARSAKKYDAYGHLIETAYFATDGSPAVSSSAGAHRLVDRYDDRGRWIERRYFGVRGPARLGDVLQHLTRLGYDDRGNLTEVAHFGLNGQPTIGYWQNQRCVRWTGTYGADSRLVSQKCEQK
jgi:hypothetical protein